MTELTAVEAVTGAIGSAAPTRAQILDFERLLAEQPGAVTELPTFHHFAPGVYSRELHIPAGYVLTGKTHRHAHMNFLMAGDITVWIDGAMQRIQAPKAFVSQPGTKRIGYAHSDVIWVTVHPTQETDLAKIEAEVIALPEFEGLPGEELEVLP